MEDENPVKNVPSQDSSLTSLDDDLIGAPNVTIADKMVVLKGEAPTTSVTDEESESGSLPLGIRQRPGRSDAWSTRMREKYGLDTSEFTYNPSESNRYQQVQEQPAEERKCCTIM